MMKVTQKADKHIKVKELQRKFSRKKNSPKKTSHHQMKMKSVTVKQGEFYSSKIIGKGTVQIGNKNEKAENVILVEDMKHNLLSVSQICDQGHKLTFDSQKCEIRKEGSGKLVATAARTSRNIYVL